MKNVPVTRRFLPIAAVYQKDDLPLDEIWSSIGRVEPVGWGVLLDAFRVVILADAGAGKTFELKAAAERQRTAGKASFFVRIEDIDDGLDESFEIGTAKEFTGWLGGTQQAWFFLDSVDEIRLTEPRAFERAIRTFAGRIRDARHRAHIYISSRPYAWRTAADRALIEEYLPVAQQRVEQAGEEDFPSDLPRETATPGGRSTDASEKESLEPLVSLYQLAPLDEADVRLFAKHNGINNPDAFVGEIDRGALMPLARVPFDLGDLMATWSEQHALASRLEIIESGIRRQLTVSASPKFLPSAERTAEGAELLAMTAMLTGLPNIRLPGFVSDDAIDTVSILSGWTALEIEALLRTGVFSDPIYGAVRFRHREIRELLAAHWVFRQLGRAGVRSEIEALIFRNPYGEDLIAPRLRPILPWLILFDAGIRDRVLRDYPEVAIEGGDAARLPFDIRRRMLGTLIKTVIDPDSGLRGLDNTAIARIAQLDLEPHVLDLITTYADNDDAIFVLGRLVWQGKMAGCVPPLAAIAADPRRDVYARLVSIRSVATIAQPEAIYALWGGLNALPNLLPRRLLAEFCDHAPASMEAVALIVASIERLEPREQFEVSGLNQALNAFVRRLPLLGGTPDAEPLFALARGLQCFVAREPHIERGECRVSEAYQWLMGPALHVVERLIEGRSPAALMQPPLELLAAAPALRFWRNDDFPERRSIIADLVPQWPELNDALFWWTVAERRTGFAAKGERLADDWPVSWMGHFWAFDRESFTRLLAWISELELVDDRLVALARSVRIYHENNKPAALLRALRRAVAGVPELESKLDASLNPPVSPDLEEHRLYERNRRKNARQRERRDTAARAAFASRLAANPDIVRCPPGVKPGNISNEQYHLLRMIEGDDLRSSRAQGANWPSLIPEFGHAVAQAYRDAAVAFWRVYKPGVRSKGANTSSIPYALIFAMAGLDIELGDGTGAQALSHRDAKHALLFGPWELNGFPRWYESLCKVKPKAVRDFLWQEARWELENSPPDQPLHYMLNDLVYYAPWLLGEIAPRILDWLTGHDAPSEQCLSYCRAILMGGGATVQQISALAIKKIVSRTTARDQLPVWHALRVDADPALGVPMLTDLYDSGTLLDPNRFGADFNNALLGSRRDVSPVFGTFRTPTYLKQLYLLAHRVVQVADDIQRAGKGAYSPTARDDAQDARERLFALLAEIPGPLVYNAILELAETHPEPSYRGFMRSRARERATIDSDLHAWKANEVAEFADRLAARPIMTPEAESADAAH